MPKENTHIYFADKLAKNSDAEIADIIIPNLEYLYLGSISPDTFYYSKKSDIAQISDIYHGKDGNPTNEIIFEMLDFVKENKSERDFVFVLGFISHCALDITWHPIIYYLSGNYYDADTARREEAIYLHRHLETHLDNLVNDSFYVHEYIKNKTAQILPAIKFISDRFKISKGDCYKAYARQISSNKLFKNDVLFSCAHFLHRAKVLKLNTEKGLFYGNLKRDNRAVENEIKYKDLITGEDFTKNIEDIFKEAKSLSGAMMAAAYKYYIGQISRSEAEKVITGASLDTGKVGSSAGDIKFLRK